MRNLIPRHADYNDAGATEIEHGPHWSQLPRVAPRPEIAARPVPPRLPRAHQINAADRVVAPTPVAPALPAAAAPVAFYSFAEEQAALASPQAALASPPAACPWSVDTERVAPLPFGSIRPSWIDALDRMWSRFAAPALGVIAGLILVVGYLAYSTQAAPVASASASAATASRPVAPSVVMTAELDEPAAATEIAPPAAPVIAPPASPTVSQINTAPVAAKPARVKKSKRAPIRINDATPLGDLRPSR